MLERDRVAIDVRSAALVDPGDAETCAIHRSALSLRIPIVARYRPPCSRPR
ncbi:hypothetical protein NJ7G_1619 [Natrinema sp. J7-2]|nr:hypothetical protein NJ7G_1619 [Natrinema sp. J7-2]